MAVIDALGPVFLLVLMGAALKRLAFPGDAFWAGAERLTYYVFFPALLLGKLSKAPFSWDAFGHTFLAVVILLAGATVLLLALSRRLASDAAAFTSVYQGAVRFNAYVGFAAAESLWGEPGLAAAAITATCMIPLINLLCIGVFALKVGGGGPVVRQIATNPLILACLAGLLLNVSGIGTPGWMEPLLALLGAPALPVGLLAVGVGLAWGGARATLAPLAVSGAVKLALFPVAALFVGRWVGLDVLSLQVLVLFFAVPTASSAYILARQLGGDAPLMASLVTGQTLIAMATLPLVLQIVP